MKQCFILLLLLQLFIAGYPQNSTISYDANKALQLNFGIGGYYNDFKNLNKRLSDAGYLSTGRFALSNLMEVDFRNKNFLIGLNSGMGISSRKNDDYKTQLANFYGGLNFGYYIANSKKFHLAPQAGIGLYSSFIKISSRNGYDNFDELLNNSNSITINQYVPALDFCFRFDFADFTKTRSPLTGFRLGYKLGLSNRGWGINESSTSTLDNSPKDRVNQFYVLATLGYTGQKPNKMR